MTRLGIRNHFALILASLILVSLVTRCTDEESKGRAYPRMTGTRVTDITESGATFITDLYDLGTMEITQHGFVWGFSESMTVGYSNKVFLGPDAAQGIFKADIRSTLKKGVKYYMRPFIQTESKTIYGPVITFVSLGSEAPVITGFSPEVAGWADTITIRGRNFSYVPNDNIVKLNDHNCLVVKATDSVLVINIPQEVTDHKNGLSIEIAGNVNNFKADSLEFIPPTFTDFRPREGTWNDTITIIGSYLSTIGTTGYSFIKLSDIKCTIMSWAKDSIKVRVPDGISVQENNFSVVTSTFNLTVPQKFTLLPPYFTFSPKTATWGNTITLTGRFNAVRARNQVLIGSVAATIQTITPTQIKVTVPQTLNTNKSIIRNVVTPFSAACPDTFRLISPYLKSISPLSGRSGKLVTIKGKYFGSNQPTVKFGSVTASISSYNDSIVNVTIPSGLIGGMNKVTVTAQSVNLVFPTDFNVTNPRIDAISKTSGTFGDELTITGANFIPETGSPTLYIGSYQAGIVSYNSTTIVTTIPTTIDSIPGKVNVNLNLLPSGSLSAYSTEKFTVLPPEIYSADPTVLVPGGDVVITGNNFCPVPANNSVTWGNYKLNVKSATRTEIVATFPQYLPRWSGPIVLKVAGYKRNIGIYAASNSPWRSVPVPANFDSYSGNYGAGIGNYGYVASSNKTDVYRFDPVNDSWTATGAGYPYSPNYSNVDAGRLTAGDTMYVIMGQNYYARYIKMYNPAGNKWTSIAGPAATIVPVAFWLNNKLYFGLDNYNLTGAFYEADPGKKYLPVRKGDFGTSIPVMFSGYFTLNNKGYVVFSNNQVWMFDPDLMTWSRKADFPGTPRYHASAFILNGSAYFGTGAKNGATVFYGDLWKYDETGDSWTYLTTMPVVRSRATVFVVNNKAYIGFGFNYTPGYTVSLNDLFEFDPSYSGK
ncbi:MAG: IPT/TIG domain-containing protein [Bacteroidales bacterium]